MYIFFFHFIGHLPSYIYWVRMIVPVCAAVITTTTHSKFNGEQTLFSSKIKESSRHNYLSLCWLLTTRHKDWRPDVQTNTYDTVNPKSSLSDESGSKLNAASRRVSSGRCTELLLCGAENVCPPSQPSYIIQTFWFQVFMAHRKVCRRCQTRFWVCLPRRR